MKTILAILLLATLPAYVYAQDFATRMSEAYHDTDNNFDLDCYYTQNKTWKLITPLGPTIKGSNILSRTFDVDNGVRRVRLDFSVKLSEGNTVFEALFDQRHLSSGKVKVRDILLPFIADRSFQEEFETNRVMCSVNFAYAAPFPMGDGNYHINVHPHTLYDWQNRLKEPVEKYLNDYSFMSIVLLETGNVRGNLVSITDFFAGIPPRLPEANYPSTLESVPYTVPLIVSPAGNSRYDIKAESEINVTLTGGNHNYCIWNTARHIIEGLMNSRSQAVVNFRYDMSAIVAQVRGVEGMSLNFPRRSVSRSNLLKDLLADKSLQASYHANYLSYFSGYLAREYAGMYKTYTLDYQAEGFSKVVTIQGTGKRDLKVTFRYFQ